MCIYLENMMMKTVKLALLLVVTMGAVCNADLIAHYEFEGNGNDSANNNDGTLMGDASYEGSLTYGGKDFGQALSLDGVGAYMDCGATFSAVTAGSTKTAMAWAKSNTTDYTSGSGRILTLYRGNNNGRGESAFTIFPSGYPDIDPATWQSGYMKTATSFQSIDSGVSIDISTWAHIALVQDDANIFLYINGQLEASESNGAAPTVLNPLNAYIGAYANPSSNSNFFNGLIDDVRIYDHALSQSEILAIVPEPCSLMLLSLGGLILRRRRR
jgi:hypothetical protein